ncbi:SRPBCC family protein [Antarcticimicrobium sediminis]|uniref:SRPBCC family protein n=1 Tax=Antarcticimicrobium sediminis TaxID=2546227 RepID=A0A4R5ENG2_9RHOB|nr:SRPBCC family protein [Antarcticimicrobium sediminis]TDE36255.1 SRPBCC family protein [Antarcticimicrobium sediminis]
MQFSSKEDIDAPIEAVFAAISDFEMFERSVIRRGIEVERVDDTAAVAPGLAWNAAFDLRGKRRKLHLTLSRFESPEGVEFESESAGLTGLMSVDLVALSPRRTRMAITLNLAPKTLSARLFLQSLKLAKGNLTKRFKLKVADFAKSVEDRQPHSA